MAFPFENLSGTIITASGQLVTSSIPQSGYGISLSSGLVNPFPIASGEIDWTSFACECKGCGKLATSGDVHVSQSPISSGVNYCWNCAGFTQDNGFGFHDQKAEWIEASVSGMFYDEKHKGIIVDWLDENQRPGDAAFLREYYGLEVK